MANPTQKHDREPGTRPDGEAAPPQTIDPERDGVANDDGVAGERPQADPEMPALGEWQKRRGGSSTDRATSKAGRTDDATMPPGANPNRNTM
jgi:hypothetical protein